MSETPNEIRERLEHLRGELRAERISWGEMLELQGLTEYIDPGDAELLEAAGVPEPPPGDVSDADWQAMCVRAHDAENRVSAILALTGDPTANGLADALYVVAAELRKLGAPGFADDVVGISRMLRAWKPERSES